MQNKTLHVIVCDDDAELNLFIRNFFKLDGYETHQALSAKECIDKLTELGDTIDAIIVNGKIASDRSAMLILNVKRMNKNVKVFVLADRNLSEEKTRIMDYGADEFAVKPLSIESLIKKVNLTLLEAAKSAS
ncbi:MAG TPA: response regulator [Nitrososphaera sp.]|jgi:DNA-binding response OmpR family regulator|nr:response regulator [Nitrososphaera sp.]